MSQIETAVTLSRTLETILVERFNANGKGLHEKVSSVERILPEDLVRQIRYIATIRNAVVHEDGYQIANLADFVASAEAAAKILGELPVPAVSAPALTSEDLYGKIPLWVVRLIVLIGIVTGAGAGVQAQGWLLGLVTGIGGGLLAWYSTWPETIAWYKSMLRGLMVMAMTGAVVTTIGTILYLLCK